MKRKPAQQCDRLFASSADISPCGSYRWSLVRSWDAKPPLFWIMLNPSTADATVNDPTIRRCISFAREWGFGGIEVRNLFALRATNPAALLAHADPIGPAGNYELAKGLMSPVVVAWGKLNKILAYRAREVFALLAYGKINIQCLGTNHDGSPRHPLYLPASTKLQPFIVPSKALQTSVGGHGNNHAVEPGRVAPGGDGLAPSRKKGGAATAAPNLTHPPCSQT